MTAGFRRAVTTKKKPSALNLYHESVDAQGVEQAFLGLRQEPINTPALLIDAKIMS